MAKDLLTLTDHGLYCEAGDFHVDPWRAVHRAVITHAHGDHARRGSENYLATPHSEPVLRKRLGKDINLDQLPYGETTSINGVKVSLHPAGHVLGSAQVRIEHRGQVWVVSGDYKLAPDGTSTQFEAVPCDVFITECTFGLPVYRWPDQQRVFDEINAWWARNASEGIASVVFAYGFGKAQRVLSGLDASIGPIYCHGAVESINDCYREVDVPLPHTEYAGRVGDGEKKQWRQAMIVAPPSAQGSTWMRKFGNYSAASASGWMQIRGTRRRRGVDRGFVLSDHADWPDLLTAIEATGARRILATHGYTGPMVRWLTEQGYEAQALQTLFVGETGEDDFEDADQPEAELVS